MVDLSHQRNKLLAQIKIQQAGIHDPSQQLRIMREIERLQLSPTAWLVAMAEQLQIVFVPGVKGDAVHPYVNHGRWLANCPYCAGAELVDPDFQQFFCFSCGMIQNESRPQPILFSKDAERVELLLKARPASHQNWQPHESLKQLEAENQQHKVK